MENVMANGFEELSAMEMNEVDGGSPFSTFCYYTGYLLGAMAKNAIKYTIKPIIC